MKTYNFTSLVAFFVFIALCSSQGCSGAGLYKFSLQFALSQNHTSSIDSEFIEHFVPPAANAAPYRLSIEWDISPSEANVTSFIPQLALNIQLNENQNIYQQIDSYQGAALFGTR